CAVCFYSSRRRHRRLVSDWSSDVCSSDLLPLVLPPAVAGLALLVAFGPDGLVGRGLRDAGIVLPLRTAAVVVALVFVAAPFHVRSEERRVGKGCGGGGATHRGVWRWRYVW